MFFVTLIKFKFYRKEYDMFGESLSDGSFSYDSSSSGGNIQLSARIDGISLAEE